MLSTGQVGAVVKRGRGGLKKGVWWQGGISTRKGV